MGQQQIQEPRKKHVKLIIVAISIVIIIFSWVGITKANYISNLLDYLKNPNTGCNPFSDNYDLCKDEGEIAWKPVIYLYPNQKKDIEIKLDYQGKLVADYPEYNEFIKGWDVTAYPDGHLINKADNQEYSYLFWEGISSQPINWDLSTGFVVKGSDTREFLQTTLSQIGLTPKEYNEFIVYWYPKMKDNSYNLIHFADKQYTETAPLVITPKPDSILRVFMVFKPLEEKIKIQSQEIKSFTREGFTVVEWGGTEL